MAEICEFGTANEQKKDGFVGIGTVIGTAESVLGQFFSGDVKLVRGRCIDDDTFEFFVMVRTKDPVSAQDFDAARLERAEILLRAALTCLNDIPNRKVRGLEKIVPAVDVYSLASLVDDFFREGNEQGPLAGGPGR